MLVRSSDMYPLNWRRPTLDGWRDEGYIRELWIPRENKEQQMKPQVAEMLLSCKWPQVKWQEAGLGRSERNKKRMQERSWINSKGKIFLRGISHSWRKWIGFLPTFITFLWFSNLGVFYFSMERGKTSGAFHKERISMTLLLQYSEWLPEERWSWGETSLREKRGIAGGLSGHCRSRPCGFCQKGCAQLKLIGRAWENMWGHQSVMEGALAS